jgi:hypothetical protein
VVDYRYVLEDTIRPFEAGDVLLVGYGFAQITACKFEIATGRVVAHVQTDHVSPRRSLAGIAEFPG